MNSSISPEEVKARLLQEAALVESWLGTALRGGQTPQGLLEAMEYSLLAGGKRIRPALCLVSARMCGEDAAKILPFACALECIHTYSLIHDDLPALDNDDLRRGRPSNHKRFDEATAILAGDGLLTDAFALMAKTTEYGIPAERALCAIGLAAQAAGSPGMVGGQYLDIRYTARPGVTLEDLAAMHAMKTGAMFRVACEAGAVLAGADGAARSALRTYGVAIGAAFQITDDILDEVGDEKDMGKPVGSDATLGKNTYPSLVGLKVSREMALAYVEKATEALRAHTGDAADLLRGLAAYMANRVS